MQDFKQLETRFDRTAVKLIDYDGATGVLHLEGRNSVLHVSSDAPFSPNSVDENGWFNIRLRASDGRELLLYHALQIGSGSHGLTSSDEAYTTNIFPNVVLADAEGCSGTSSVRRISCRLRNLSDFFYYRHAECLDARRLTETQKEVLESLRHNPAWGPFIPGDVYVVHNYPEFFRFRVANRTYSVWPGGSRTLATVSTLDTVVYPVPTIEFDEPVELQEALDSVWEWRNFFNQVAQATVPFESLWVHGPGDEHQPARVYLPNLDPPDSTGRTPFEISAHNVPLNQWEERGKLADAMTAWLSTTSARQVFRSRLDRVLDDMARRVNPSDLIELSAGIESLDELASKEKFPNGLLDKIVDAAVDAAAAEKFALPAERLRGIVGSLQRPSLRMRLIELGRRVSPAVPDTDAELLANSVALIRNTSAHGASLDAQVQPRVSPTIGALAALCARFDLETAGVPSRGSNGARSWPIVKFEEAISFLKQLEAKAI